MKLANENSADANRTHMQPADRRALCLGVARVRGPRAFVWGSAERRNFGCSIAHIHAPDISGRQLSRLPISFRSLMFTHA